MQEMRMAELAERSGLGVPTIKYYLREGLLEPGRRTHVNQAVYGAAHLERLRLIRALSKVAGLPLSTIRDVVLEIDAGPTVLDAMALTQDALVGDVAPDSSDEDAAALVHRVVRTRAWTCQVGSPAYQAAVRAVADLGDEDLGAVIEHLDDYARAADDVARIDVQAIAAATSLDETIRGVVLGTIYRRSLLDALVLLAQQHHASELAAGSIPSAE